VESLQDANFKKVLVVTTQELPLEDVLKVEVDSFITFGVLELLDNFAQDLEEVHPGFVF
jgi:hypothetical protein